MVQSITCHVLTISHGSLVITGREQHTALHQLPYQHFSRDLQVKVEMEGEELSFIFVDTKDKSIWKFVVEI